MSFTVDGKFVETRTPPEPKEKDKPAETEEEKKAADEAFAKALADKKKKLADEQTLQSRIFIIAKSSLDPILKKRPDFMKDAPAAAANPSGIEPKPPLPPASPAKAPRIEAVTPPVSVEIPPSDDKKKEEVKKEEPNKEEPKKEEVKKEEPKKEEEKK